MSERPFPAAVVSVLAHLALIGAAALIPVKVARGGAAPKTDQGPDTALVEDEGGFHGNTVDIDGFEEGALGDGSPVETEKAAPEPKPKKKAKKAKKARKKRKKRRRKAKPTSAPKAPGPGDGGADETGGGKSAGEGEGGKRHGTKEANEGQLSAAGAFTHALAISFSANPIWHELPMGDAGSTTIALTVKDGKVTDTKIPKDAPKLLKKLAKGAATMMRMHRLKASGVTRITISVALSQKDVPPQDDLNGTTVLQARDVAPSVGKPGGVFFTYASGRHVKITVALP